MTDLFSMIDEPATYGVGELIGAVNAVLEIGRAHV